MSVEEELKRQAYNIEFFAKRAAEDVACLEQYSGWLLSKVNQIQAETLVLREQNKKLKEALKFYADLDRYNTFREDRGEYAQKVLEEIENEKR